MIRNYLITAVRNIRRNKLASFITIIGFAVGIACAALIFTYIRYELSFDKFFKNHSRIRRVLLKATTYDYKKEYYRSVDYHMKEYLMSRNTGIKNLTQVLRVNGIQVKCGGIIYREENTIIVTDNSFLKVFHYPLIKGNPDEVLEKPFSIVITPDMAKKYFGSEDPVGKTLSVKYQWGEITITVTGIIAPAPKNATIRFDFVANVPNYAIVEAAASYFNVPLYDIVWSYEHYVELIDIHSLPSLENTLKDANKVIPDGIKLKYRNVSYFTEPFDGIYLFSPAEAAGNFTVILLLILLGAIIIVIACLNVINLTTARSLTRMKEIGIRKTFGASKKQLVFQYLTESIILSFISMWLALMLVELFLPLFGRLVNREQVMTLSADPVYPMVLFGFSMIIGILAGLYPAFYLSSLNISNTFMNYRLPSSKRFREILVTVQFIFSVILFLSASVIYRESQFLRKKDLGFNPKDIIMIRLDIPHIEEQFTKIKTEFQNTPGVEMVSGSSLIAWGYGTGQNNYNLISGGKVITPFLINADPDFLRIHGIKIKEGTDFSGKSDFEIIVNETLAKAMNYHANDYMTGYSQLIGRIVGIASDFNFLFPARKIDPLIISVRPFIAGAPSLEWFYLLIKISPENKAAVIENIKKTWERLNTGYIFDYQFESKAIENYYSNNSYETIFAVSTVLAFLLSCLGLFGLASYEIERRRKEIGIRKVVGASSNQIMLHFLAGFFKLIGLANIIAWPVTFIIIRIYFTAIQYPYPLTIGPLVFLQAGILSFIVTLLTVGTQTVSAAASNPADSLRYE